MHDYVPKCQADVIETDAHVLDKMLCIGTVYSS